MRFTLRQLQQHHATYYTPQNAVLTVAGPVDHEQVVAAAGEHFGRWQGGRAPAPKAWAGFFRDDRLLRWVRDAGSQVSLQLAFLLPGRNSEHAVNLRVLRRLLGWGGMSRLMLRLREELGLTYTVDAALALYADAGTLAIDLAVSTENLATATTAILDILTELPPPKSTTMNSTISSTATVATSTIPVIRSTRWPCVIPGGNSPEAPGPLRRSRRH